MERSTTCLDCGEVITIPQSSRHVGGTAPEARCPACRSAKPKNPAREERRKAYNTASWRRFSRSMRSGPVVCADCGASSHLTTDHSTTAWRREEKGLPRRRIDYEVLCTTCNSKRGAARGPLARGRL